MSRKGKAPIAIPQGVEVKVAASKVHVKGPKGSLELVYNSAVNVAVENKQVLVTLADENSKNSKFHGLYRMLIQNLVDGVTKGFEKTLELVGVGYRAALEGQKLSLSLGFSHPVQLNIPEHIAVKVEKNTTILISGMDKQNVGEFAAKVRAIRPPEPYQGKGVRYKDEHIIRKAGKSAASGK